MYLATLLVFFLFAVWLEWKYRFHLYHTVRERILITFLFFVVGVTWDSVSTIEKTWVYTGKGLVGIWIGVLPLEEYLFSLVVPYWILTVYRLLNKKASIGSSVVQRAP